MSDLEGLYDGREQTLVKHEVLRRYLQRFAFKIGSWSDSITYVDCYSGPWDERSEQFADTSFGIAIEQLRNAKRELEKDIRLRCYFIEKDRTAYAKLNSFASAIDDVQIETRNASFEHSVNAILEFVAEDRRTFPFFLIDPKGWSIPLDVIRPLLAHRPGEVLITFMLEFIRRFAEHPSPAVQQTIDALYGEKNVSRVFSGVRGDERDDLLLAEYRKRVKHAGNFDFASSSLVVHPEKARRHFNLVYLTRNHKGLEVFKEAEKAAMGTMESARAKAAKRRRESGGQLDLLPAEEMHNNTYFEGLRDRYLEANAERMMGEVEKRRTVSFDDLWASSLETPLIWPTDINSQLLEWKREGRIAIQGLSPRERTPKYGKGHTISVRA